MQAEAATSGKRALDSMADVPQAKSQRINSDKDEATPLIVDVPLPENEIVHTRPSLLPAPALEDAILQIKMKFNVEMEIGKRLEVCWEVVDDAPEVDEKEETSADAPTESTATDAVEVDPEHVWWGCRVAELVGLDSEDGPVWNLVYDAKVVDGKEFAPEERNVAFCGKNMLIDLESNERRVGGGDLGLMQWRVEGSKDDLPPLLPVGLSIKARFKGGDTWYAGKITALNRDGSYAIHYADGDMESNVHRDMIEFVEDEEDEAEGLDDTPVIAESIDDFFEIFTAQMTSGEMFRRLDPEKQRLAAEKMAQMRPLFRDELEKLMETRGKGTTVRSIV